MSSNSVRLLTRLDEMLESPADITLYGRAALELGFPNPKPEYSRSLDVDIVLWMGQAEELQKSGNFWDALQKINDDISTALKSARIPDIPEIHEQFELCKKWLLEQFPVLPK